VLVNREIVKTGQAEEALEEKSPIISKGNLLENPVIAYSKKF
jgi:hypothetical protein